MHTSSHEVMRWVCDREQRGLWTRGSLVPLAIVILAKCGAKLWKWQKKNQMVCGCTLGQMIFYVQGLPTLSFPIKGDGGWKKCTCWNKVQTSNKQLDLQLAGISPPSLFIRAYVIPRWNPKVRLGKNRVFFTPGLCHWDIMGPVWPKALFWFPSNGEENGSQRKVSVSVRCSLVRLRNAKNNTAGLVLRTRRGNYKLKTLDLRTFPGI